MDRPRAADDFATIRARIEELRRERQRASPNDEDARRNALMPRGGGIRWPVSEVSSGRSGSASQGRG